LENCNDLRHDIWHTNSDGDNWTLKFEIMEIYEAEKYDDVVISEIFFDGIGCR
jgi:hypothetical protein